MPESSSAERTQWATPEDIAAEYFPLDGSAPDAIFEVRGRVAAAIRDARRPLLADLETAEKEAERLQAIVSSGEIRVTSDDLNMRVALDANERLLSERDALREQIAVFLNSRLPGSAQPVRGDVHFRRAAMEALSAALLVPAYLCAATNDAGARCVLEPGHDIEKQAGTGVIPACDHRFLSVPATPKESEDEK